MTKADFVNAICKSGVASTKVEAEKALDVILDELKNIFINGDSITFNGFGSFKTEDRLARKGRNPRTGEEIDIPAQKVVKFTPAKALKEQIAKN